MNAPRPIRVMHVLPWVTAGGVERRRMQLAQRLSSERFEQRVVCLHSKYDFVHEIEDAGVEVVSFQEGKGSVFDLRSLLRVVREIRRFRPDIIHGAVFEGVTLAALAGTFARVPHIVVEETGDPSVRSWRGDALMGVLSRLADRTVGVSPAITDYLVDRLRLDSRHVVLVMNGVDAPREPTVEELSAARAEFGLSEDDFIIGSAGRIDNDHKRYTDLMEAVAELSSEADEVRLVIVGSGADRALLERTADELEIADRVVFTGYRQDMGLMYHLMDVFALASRQESFGLVLAEAMFCGVPVVATSVGGIPYIVEDGATGFLVEPFRPDELARSLDRLYRDPSLRRRLGEASRARAETHFSSSRYVDDVASLYLELMSE